MIDAMIEGLNLPWNYACKAACHHSASRFAVAYVRANETGISKKQEKNLAMSLTSPIFYGNYDSKTKLFRKYLDIKVTVKY